nr:hypothetical protein [Staphylococcus argenteus]AXH79947.1 hypothetical protein [Staphylococcus argenteus]AXH79954.1 hypothetical protein [Staphylococcus argenteus]AXH79960.1 hypothetical protein [Staphylococcus argenteus]AXH79967.1 hypothetical protein [Staphylococcus argenteus]
MFKINDFNNFYNRLSFIIIIFNFNTID